jgi:hypothetical protein
MVDPISATNAKWQTLPSTDVTNESEYYHINSIWQRLLGKHTWQVISNYQATIVPRYGTVM